LSENKITIDVKNPKNRISRYIYGHFAEHLGRCIYDGFWVGKDSGITNKNGIRKDLIDAFRKLKIPVLRWPGGCFADEYHWKDGIGPEKSRPGMVNTNWGGVTENNHFGTHEFMNLCSELECEPYICGNVGSGSVKEMQEWVEYITFSGKSPMSELRKKNGRSEPWKLRFFGVGNENWGCGGNMRAEYYSDLYKRYSTYCRNYGDNRLYKIAGGANGFDYNWTEILMKTAANFMDGLSLHYYTVKGTWENKGSATDFDKADWFTTIKKTGMLDEIIKGHSDIMDKYDPEKRVGMIVDEWGLWHDCEPGTNLGFLYQQNTLRDAVCAGISLNILNNNSNRVYMANIAQAVNVLQAMALTKDDMMILTPTYHIFEMYKKHQDSLLLESAAECSSYSYNDESIPALSVSASLSRNEKINISICNTDPSNSISAFCILNGKKPVNIKGRILTSDSINAYNEFDNPDNVKPSDFSKAEIRNDIIELEMPSKSAVVFEVEVK
jgi:alpha-L-arabinofuranosidase